MTAICFFNRINPKTPEECIGSDCSLWDWEKNQCLIASYLAAYAALPYAMVKLQEATEKLNKATVEMEEED